MAEAPCGDTMVACPDWPATADGARLRHTKVKKKTRIRRLRSPELHAWAFGWRRIDERPLTRPDGHPLPIGWGEGRGERPHADSLLHVNPSVRPRSSEAGPVGTPVSRGD